MRLHGKSFGGALITLGVMLGGSAVVLGGPALTVLWPATSVIVVGLGYVALGPGVFGKRPDGTLMLLPTAFLFPFHVAAWLRLRWNARDGRAPFDQVAPGLYLGRRLVDVSELPPGTQRVVDLTAEFRATRGVRERCEYRLLPTLDTTVPDFERFARLVDETAASADATYVHCAAGYGRSAAFAAALLIARGLASDVEDAERILRAARPKVFLHPGQRAHVQRYAEGLAQRAEGLKATNRPATSGT